MAIIENVQREDLHREAEGTARSRNFNLTSRRLPTAGAAPRLPTPCACRSARRVAPLLRHALHAPCRRFRCPTRRSRSSARRWLPTDRPRAERSSAPPGRKQETATQKGRYPQSHQRYLLSARGRDADPPSLPSPRQRQAPKGCIEIDFYDNADPTACCGYR